MAKWASSKFIEEPSASDAGYFGSETARSEDEGMWSTELCDCLAWRQPDFISVDTEICVLGTFAPSVLFATTRDRLTGRHEDCVYSCLIFTVLSFIPYIGLPLVACATCGTRYDIRDRFGINKRSLGKSMYTSCRPVSISSDEKQRWEVCGDCLLHLFCLRCALCQEAREIRRHPPLHTHSSPHYSSTCDPPKMQAMG